ncbi:MAG TPA: proline dehydrogenase family protein [Thermoleophilaceae bacterium]
MRSALLWSARNAWMRDHVPHLPFAQRAVRRFMPGEHLEDALAAADRLNAQGFGVLFTHLGENLTRLTEADAVAEHYHDVLERGRTRARPIEISVKPTQLGLDIDEDACLRHCESLAAHAQETGTWLWLDMEGSSYTEVTVALYERLKASHPKTGIALQAYLRRTAGDVQRILPLQPAVRLVKGAYDEPAAAAYRGRSEVDGNYQTLAVVLAQAAGKGVARLALGTHDVELICRITTMAEASGTARGALEVHMLYGIRADQLARLAREGYSCSSLVAYGEFWYAWYMRRLAERPANIVFALRQLLP